MKVDYLPRALKALEDAPAQVRRAFFVTCQEIRRDVQPLAGPRQQGLAFTSTLWVIRSGHSMLSGIIHLSSQIFFRSPLTLTLRDTRQSKVADGTNVVS